MTDASKERGVIDLVAIEVQDRQHGAVGDRVEKLVAVPASGEGTSLGLPVTHHNYGNKIRMIIDGAIGVRDAIAQFAALVDAAGRFGSAMAAYAARERKLFEEALHPRYVFAHVGINLGVRSLKIVLGQNSRRTVAGS